MESSAAIFTKIALEKGLLDEKQLDQAKVLVDLAKKDGKAVGLAKACLDLEWLSAEQVKGIERGVQYYVVRKADKMYGKLAVAKKYADADTVEHCLQRQHGEFYKKHRLVRLSKLLAGLEAITPEQDAELREAVRNRLTPEESKAEMQAVTEAPRAAAATPEPMPVYDSEAEADEPAPEPVAAKKALVPAKKPMALARKPIALAKKPVATPAAKKPISKKLKKS